MSLTNPNNVVTESRLKEFYNGILPYLGGSADAGFTPVGTIIAMDSNTPPANYLACDGTVYNIADYPELAEHYKRQYGAANHYGGNGTTTFAVIDLRGEFLRGTGTNSHSGNGSGSAVGTHQDATRTKFFSINGTNIRTSDTIDGTGYADSSSGAVSTNYVDIAFSAKTGAYTNWITSRPTNTSVLYCIATKNIYLNPSLDYSTDEKVVGTWIDGKTLYQRTITGTTITDGLGTRIDITNIPYDYIAISTAVLKRKNGAFIPAQAENTTDGGPIKFVAYIEATKKILILVADDANNKGATYYITIQYTKTS